MCRVKHPRDRRNGKAPKFPRHWGPRRDSWNEGNRTARNRRAAAAAAYQTHVEPDAIRADRAREAEDAAEAAWEAEVDRMEREAAARIARWEAVNDAAARMGIWIVTRWTDDGPESGYSHLGLTDREVRLAIRSLYARLPEEHFV